MLIKNISTFYLSTSLAVVSLPQSASQNSIISRLATVNQSSHSKMGSNQEDLEKLKKKRLEIMFNDPNIKMEDVIIAVGETEIEEKIRSLTELKDKLEDEEEDLLSVKEMTEEIDKCYEEFDKILADMKRMRNEQLKVGGGVKCEMMRDMLREMSGQVDENEQKEQNFLKDIEIATETEKKLKEQLHIAKNELSIKQDARRKQLERRENGGFNGGQKNSNRR